MIVKHVTLQYQNEVTIMKTIKSQILPILIAISLFSGCRGQSNTNATGEVLMQEYYKLEDFRWVTIGETNFQDVYKIATSESMQITSYGGVCEYPIYGGGYIRIKFYGKDLVVGSLEKID